MIVQVLLTKAQAQALGMCAAVGLELEDNDWLFHRAHIALHALDQRVVRQPGDHAWLITRPRVAGAIADRAEEMAAINPEEHGGSELVREAVAAVKREVARIGAGHRR